MADYARKRSGSADDGGDNSASITFKCDRETNSIKLTVHPTNHIHKVNDIFHTCR